MNSFLIPVEKEDSAFGGSTAASPRPPCPGRVGSSPCQGLTPINGEWKYKLFKQQPGECRDRPSISPNTQGSRLTGALIAAGGKRERERGAVPAHSRAEHPPRHLPLRTSCLFNNLPEPGTFPGLGNTSSLRRGKIRAFPALQQGSHLNPSPVPCRGLFSPRAALLFIFHHLFSIPRGVLGRQ